MLANNLQLTKEQPNLAVSLSVVLDVLASSHSASALLCECLSSEPKKVLVLVLILWNSPVFPRKIITSADFHWYCAPTRQHQ